MKLFSIAVLFATACLHAQVTVPKTGLYPVNLVFFDDDLNKGVTVQSVGGHRSVERNVKKEGTASWRWEVRGNDEVMIYWGGPAKDTTVFWVHDNSHLSFWAMANNPHVKIRVMLGYDDGRYEIIPFRIVGPAGSWRLFDVIVPFKSVGRHLNVVKVSTENPPSGSVLYFDEMRISNVRLYAGKGETVSISGVFADQIGYDTFGIKTFSAERHASFQIVRESDKQVVYSGRDIRIIESKYLDDRGAWVGDFTSFRVPGRYFVRLDNGKESYPFDIGPHVYDAPLRAAIRFFYYQRNNSAISMPYAEGPWVHEKDSKEEVLLPGGNRTKVVRHGWHDAGDLAIYMPNHTYACFWLALAWDEFRYDADNLNLPESGDGIPDILNELHWGLDWILDMQDPGDGGFYQNMCVRKDSPYEYGATTPLTITGYELTNKTTAATASAVGVLAYASRVFEEAGFDLPFARKMREAALLGWSYLRKHPDQVNITTGCNTYQDPDDIHARVFAAVALFLATGDDEYDTYFIANDPGSHWISDFNNQTNLAYLLYVKSPGNTTKKENLRAMLVQRAEEATNDRLRHPFGFAGYYYWGSLGTAFARVGNYSILDWRLNKSETSMSTALQQLHYTFGQNSIGFVYLSGFGVHGMKNSFHHWMKTLNATPRNFPGMLPGGPNENPSQDDRGNPPRSIGYNKPADTPIDSRYADTDSWSTNEVAVNQNAQLVYVLCAARSYAQMNGSSGGKQRP